ncbi:MAG: outer membrane beta-barrel protein [Zoogloea sp.]|nr:outer membrane beta-barrel protein [Sulfuritalea sp.]MBP6483828.1 outer membrane beta-barrel protein [Rhodoferax sp.]MBP7790578.1 outer membrane beta-barrel protein [Zoogloea sp.]
MNKNQIRDARLFCAAVAGFVGVALPAVAQESSKPSGVPVGPMVAYPEVDLTFKSNDNIYSQPASGTRKSSNITVIAPKIKLEAKDGPHTYDVGYRVEHGSYSGVSSANYTDQALSANANWVFSGRAGLKLGAEYMLGHDDQGAVPGAATHANPDKYHQTSFNALAGYGAEGAQGRVEVEGGVINKRYDNFKLTAAGLPDNTKRDRDDTKLGATFYWRVAPKTQLLFQAVQTKYDYKPNSFAGWTTLDSTDRKYLVGVTWEAAAKTTGIFKVGQTKKDFSDASLRDFSKAGWEGQIKWSPLTYSSFDFSSSKTPGESTIGNASLDTRHGVNWNHAWNSRVSSVASYNYTDTDYQSNAGVSQSDKINAYSLKVNYQWMRTIKLGAGYERTDKSSTSATSAYKRDIWSIYLNAAI